MILCTGANIVTLLMPQFLFVVLYNCIYIDALIQAFFFTSRALHLDELHTI